MTSVRTIVYDGLWKNNQALVALLGLCPLMAVTATAINGLGLGIATMSALILTNAVVALIRNHLKTEVRIPMFVLIIASVVTVIELLMNAYLHELYRVLGIFVPLIVTNCTVIGRAEAFASKRSVHHSMLDGLFMGLGFTIVLLLLGAFREALGYGTIFRQAELMFGDAARHMVITLADDFDGFLLAILPPGAFMGLAVLIAVKKIIDKRILQGQRIIKVQNVQRVTGSNAPDIL
ncbi:MAG: electron transport complex subunit E [Gammaproteobacteria bacterium]|nr:electron transport complex subunit E [Gammaproteobacteria bacterium]